MPPGQFCSNLLQNRVFTKDFGSLPHIGQIARRKSLHVGKGCPQVICQFADNSATPSFQALLLKNLPANSQIEVHKFTIGCKRGTHPGSVNPGFQIFEDRSILCGDREVLYHTLPRLSSAAACCKIVEGRSAVIWGGGEPCFSCCLAFIYLVGKGVGRAFRLRQPALG